MYKLLKSAINNWEQKNADEKVEDAGLVVKTIMVDGGRVIKRMRPAPQGRGYRVRKRSNHVTIVVDSSKNGNILPAKKMVVKAEAKPVEPTPAPEAVVAKKPAAKKAAPKKEGAAAKKAKPAVEKAEKKSSKENTKK